jgi:hypothetical protein
MLGLFILVTLQSLVLTLLVEQVLGLQGLRIHLMLGYALLYLLVSRYFPRSAYWVGITLCGLWVGTCAVGAHRSAEPDPSAVMLGFACVGAAIGSMSRSQARRTHPGSPPEQRVPPPRPPAAAPAADPWAILGIRPGAPIEEVKRAYRRRMAEYHPDKVASLGVELRELAERKSREINSAYAALSGRA